MPSLNHLRANATAAVSELFSRAYCVGESLASNTSGGMDGITRRAADLWAVGCRAGPPEAALPRDALSHTQLDSVWSAVESSRAWGQQHLLPQLLKADTAFQAATQQYTHLQLVIGSAVLAIAVLEIIRFLHSGRRGRLHPLRKALQRPFLARLPGIQHIYQHEADKAVAQFRQELKEQDVQIPALTELPLEGLDEESVLNEMEARAANDFRLMDKESTATGAIYMCGDDHRALLHDIYSMFSQTNPLHADLFPSVRRMEAEVVAMVAALLGGGPAGRPSVCGAMTSGGSESIFSAVVAAVGFQCTRRGISDPEIVIAESAHAAYWKAAQYTRCRLHVVAVSRQSFRLTAADVLPYLSPNTVLVVASAVTYPHGVLDDVEGIGRLCARRRICLHVDACLGGFVLPFMRRLGHVVPPFDFSVPGVTSMSADTHKYGLAHKGTSVVLYASRELRKWQYTAVTEWSGGLYISPGLAGSRSGGLIATAWGAMRHLGAAGYEAATADMLAAANAFKEAIRSVPELEVCGEPLMVDVAFMSRVPGKFNVLQLNDLLAQRGWHLAVLQRPVALHFCFTPQHTVGYATLCQDLVACSEQLRGMKAAVSDRAKMYGMASSLSNRGLLSDVLVGVQDTLLEADLAEG